jgi:nucleotide-binding universal stress UspA family protein
MKVVLGIEDKAHGEAIVQFISKHKWASDAQFRLVHVIDTNSEMVGEVASPQSSTRLDARKHAVQDLLRTIERRLLTALPGVHTEQKIEYGSPKDGLLQQVETWKADLLIVGTHGRTGINRFLMGSVSMDVLSTAPCSVLVVKEAAMQDQGKK